MGSRSRCSRDGFDRAEDVELASVVDFVWGLVVLNLDGVGVVFDDVGGDVPGKRT